MPPLNNQWNQMQYPSAQPSQIEKSQSDQPIVGLRVWKIVMQGGLPKLRSVYKETVWPYRKALERDVLNDMGIHAVKPGIRSSQPSVFDPTAVMGGMDVLSLFNSYEADVAGEVYLWGRVDEHTEGYLADFAYPKKLYPHADLDPVIAMQLEDEYGVPCEYRPEFTKKPKPTQEQISAQQQRAAIMQQYKQQYQQMQSGMQNAYSYALMGGIGSWGLGWKP